jgi:peptide/nickel transport system substrate-binding protein
MSFFCKIFTGIKRLWLPIILVLITALTFVGCNVARFQGKTAQVSQLLFRIESDPRTFNAAFSSSADDISFLTYEPLVKNNPLTGQVEPALAKSWQISADKLQIVFTLRSGLKWSDGKRLDDVVFTYKDIYFNPAIPTTARDNFSIGESRSLPKVRKLDDRRIEFSLPEPFAPLLSSIGFSRILPAHALEASVKTLGEEGKPMFLVKWNTDTPPDEIIVNGPYKLERYDVGQRVVFRRNPYYWRKDSQGNSQPYIERIIWQIVPSSDTSLMLFRSGELDVMAVSPEAFSLLKKQEKQGQYKIYNGGPSSVSSFVVFNLNKGKRDGKPLVDPVKSRWFNTLAFRQAIAYAIDRQTILNNTFRGIGKLQDSPIFVQSPYYLSPEAGLKVYNYNPHKAKELLLKAGFRYNDKNQLLDVFDNRVRFTLMTGVESKTLELIGTQIKQDLNNIGIQVDFLALASNAVLDKVDSMKWEAALMGFKYASLEPEPLAANFNPVGAGTLYNQNSQPGQNPIEGRDVTDWEVELGQLCIQGIKELDETKRKAIYGKIQQLSQEYLPYIHLVKPLEMLVVRNRFQGIKYSAFDLPNTFWNIYEVKVAE